jgi:hypothetical protein
VQSGSLQLVRSEVQVDLDVGGDLSRDAQRGLEEKASEDWKSGLDDIGLCTSDVVAGTSEFLSPIVEQSLLVPMRALGMHNVATMKTYLKYTDGGVDMNHNAKHDLLFVPVMLNNHQLSEVNATNQKEFFVQPDGSRVYNRNFWKSSLEVKQYKGKSGNRNTFSTLDVGMFQPIWTIPSSQREEHKEALEYMRMHGPVVKGKAPVTLLSLKNVYTHYFLQGMSSPLVCAARMAGFQPLWLMRNCLLQKSNFGKNGWQFSSIDKTPKSYISLVGFCKGSEEKHNLRVITLTNRNNKFLALSNDF